MVVSREGREQARDPDTGQFIAAPSFDGGVRGRRSKPMPGGEESAGALFARAMFQHRSTSRCCDICSTATST
jgi:hypothetical protein